LKDEILGEGGPQVGLKKHEKKLTTYHERNWGENRVLMKKCKNPIGSEKVDLWENYLK
jgi:hypothetical protein